MSHDPSPGSEIQHRLVFVGGLHRSGTTPLTRLLGAHQQVSTFHDTGVKEDEGQHLQDVYATAYAHGGPGRFGFAPAAHLTEESPLATPENAELLMASWSAHWDLSRPYLVEKSPPNLLMTRFFQALFPDARFVMIVRHPVVVALATRKWTGRRMPLVRLLEHSVHAHEVFLADAAHLRSLLVIKYEHLVADPTSTLAAVGDFLGLVGPISTEGLESGRSTRYQDRWEELRSSPLPWHWLEQRWIRSRLEGRIARLGYDLDDLAAAAPFPIPRAVATVDSAADPADPAAS